MDMDVIFHIHGNPEFCSRYRLCCRPNKLCAWRHNMPSPLQVDNIFVFIRQVAPVPACWLLGHQRQVDLLTLKVVSESRVSWATSLLTANFSLPGPLCSRVTPDVRDVRRQTDRRQTKASLNASALSGQRHNKTETSMVYCK